MGAASGVERGGGPVDEGLDARVARGGRGAYPVLALSGEQGSAKSTTARVIRALVDPHEPALRGPVASERDLVIAAHNAHVVAMDNLSRNPQWLSDGLCRLSTGGGFGTRALYTDHEEALFAGQRPVLLNGIPNLCTSADLLDRTILLELPRIVEQDRRTEAELWSQFHEVRGRLLGVLLDGLSSALTHIDSAPEGELPRMADFARVVSAAEPGLGWRRGTFREAFWRHHQRAVEDALHDDDVARGVLALVEASGTWQGSATELLSELRRWAPAGAGTVHAWPKDGTRLTGHLRRIAPNLQAVGVDLSFLRTRAARMIRLEKTGA